MGEKIEKIERRRRALEKSSTLSSMRASIAGSRSTVLLSLLQISVTSCAVARAAGEGVEPFRVH
jgi:hypothetical protein